MKMSKENERFEDSQAHPLKIAIGLDNICKIPSTVQPEMLYETGNDSNIFFREAKGSIAKVLINESFRGTAVCVGEGFILSAYHVLHPLLEENVKPLTLKFDNKQHTKLQTKCDFDIIYANESDDVIVVQIRIPEKHHMKPLALMQKELFRVTEARDNHHPEGWPLCMHAAGYLSGQLTVNERMKTLHKDEMETMSKSVMFWFEKIFPKSKNELRNLKPIANMLQKEANKYKNYEERRHVYYKFLFPYEDDVYFVANLRHGASGCPCLVFDEYNDTVIHVVLLGASPKEIFAKEGAEREFPPQFVVRRGLPASSLYKRLAYSKSVKDTTKYIAKSNKSCTWMLHKP